MRLLRAGLSDPRLHLGGFLVLLVCWLAGILADRDAAPCPACPGHEESAGACLCYHVAPTSTSLPTRR